MINGIFKIDSQWSGHEIILGYYSVNVKCEDLTPLFSIVSQGIKILLADNK
jgi:hypothetical protein